MFKKLIVMAAGVFFILPATFSQTIPTTYGQDALRYSQFQPTGTARYAGMGGVNNALGGDLSSLFGNPAGLGVYNKSDFGMTLGLGFASPTSTYFNNSLRDNRSYLTIPSIGIVFSSDKNQSKSGGFRGGSFGIGYSRIANFQNKFSYSGVNNQNSLTDYILEYPNINKVTDTYYQSLDYQTDLYSLDEQAYYNYLISPTTFTSAGGSNFATFQNIKPSTQQETVTTKGAIKQWNFTYGGNFNDRFYLGASLGVPSLRYQEDKFYKETASNMSDTLNYITTAQSFLVKGTGINFKVGFIAKPTDWLRVGMSIQTPTYFGLNETSQSNLTASYKVNIVSGDLTNTYSTTGQPNVFKYNLITPARVGGGVALFFKKYGFVSADLEYVPYQTMYFKQSREYSTINDYQFNNDNQSISNGYNGALNVNIGGELRLDMYRFRAGYSKQGNPYNIGINSGNTYTTSYSAGFGIKIEDYYLDFALVNSRYNSTYVPYTLQLQQSPVVTLKNVNTQFLISGGFYF